MSLRFAVRAFNHHRTRCSPSVCSRRGFGSLSQISKSCVNIDGKPIKYVCVGEGDHAVLCLPGALGSSLTDFKPQIQGLDQTAFTVVAWDPPGYGHSRPPNRDFSPGFLQRDADYAVNLMKALNLPKFSVLGWSDGGITGIFLAAKYPENVRKMAIWGANAYITDEEAIIYEKIRDVNTWSKAMKAPMVDLYGEEEFRTMWENWVDEFVRIHREEGGDLCRKEVKALQCPLFVLHGEKDPMVANEHPHYIIENVPNSQLYTFKNGKHNIHLRYAEEFNSLVQKFLTTERSSGTGDHRFPVRLPPFGAENPAVWFAQVEAHFHLANVDDDLTKFNCVLSQLDPKFAAMVVDVICDPPGDGKYTMLKTALLNRLTEHQPEAAPSDAGIAQTKPPQLDDLLRELQALPTHVQAAVSTLNLSVDSLARVADKVAGLQPSADLASIGTQLNNISQQLKLLSQTTQQAAKSPSSTRRGALRRTSFRGDEESVYASATAPKYDVTGMPLPGSISEKDIPQDMKVKSKYHALLADPSFRGLLYPSGTRQESYRGTLHRIVTKGVTAAPPDRPVKLNDVKSAMMRDIMDAMVRDGSARVSNSPYGSRLMLTSMEEGSGPVWRSFGDYRKLNAETEKDVNRIRHLVEISDHLWGCSVFSVVNLRKDWTRIPVAPKDVAKTAVVTPFGKFEFPFMPQGLFNSDRTWHKVLDEALQGLPFCFGYLDDILIFSRDHDEHLQHVRTLFQRLSMNGIFVNPSTSVFGEPRVTFSNYSVSSTGCTPIADKTVKALENMSRPRTYADVMKLLQVISSYRRYIPSSLETLFKEAVEGTISKDCDVSMYRAEIPWNAELDKAFKDCKSLLSRATLYSQPDPFAPLSISVCVRHQNVGAVLHQRDAAPLAFLCEPLPKERSIYFSYVLGMYKAIKAFQPLMAGRDFSVLIDYKVSSDQFFASAPFKQSNRCYIANYCSQFTSDVKQVRRAEVPLARCLASFTDNSPGSQTSMDDSDDEAPSLNMSSRFR